MNHEQALSAMSALLKKANVPIEVIFDANDILTAHSKHEYRRVSNDVTKNYAADIAKICYPEFYPSEPETTNTNEVEAHSMNIV